MDHLRGPSSVNCYLNLFIYLFIFNKPQSASLVSTGTDPMTYQSHYLRWLVAAPPVRSDIDGTLFLMVLPWMSKLSVIE